MSKIFHWLFHRMVITGIAIAIQVIFLTLVLWKLSDQFIYIYGSLMVLSLLMIMYIVNKNESPSFKLPWIVLILIVPLLGGILYLFFSHHHISKKESQKWKRLYKKSYLIQIQDRQVEEKLQKEDYEMYQQASYIQKFSRSPIYQHTKTKYYPLGDDVLEDMLRDLKNAQKFIFIEYFIIQEGYFWDHILAILKEKVQEGVDVRVMYDDIGSIALLPSDYYKQLDKMGIKCIPFNRFIPVVSLFHNNRDHRKIMVIDGEVGYTGGINLADEYINKIEKHGHWKDTAIRLEGEAVQSLTILFLESWDFYREEDSNFADFLAKGNRVANDGFVQPFGDSPLDDEQVGNTVYLNMINQAQHYLYINTPYLIIDYDMLDALARASKRGVDVRLMLPHIPDKWYVHLISRSFYATLIQAGVKIYEYYCGFNHAKSFVCDDKVAVIGSINLDYRSLVHHFECGVWMYKTKTVASLKEDFIKTQEEDGILISLKEAEKIKWYQRWARGIIKFFAPLM